MTEEYRLIEQAQRGDASALAGLLQANYSFVVKYLTKISLDPHLAEDLAQETMVKCMHKIKLYKDTSKFSSWLITIATRLYIDNFRRRKREQRWRDQETASRRIKWQVERQGDQWPDVLDALGKLPEETRTSIVLKHYYGYSLGEIAEMTDAPVGTVKSRIHNGLKAIRKELNKDEG